MDSATETATRESHAKWVKLSQIEALEYVRIGPDYCPLCTLFISNYCRGCPIREATGKSRCHDTPYLDADDAYDDWIDGNLSAPKAFQAAAKDMADFIKPLIPEATQ